MPRIEPDDRAAHAGAAPAPAEAKAPPPAAQPRPRAPALRHEDMRKLQAALHELAECRKLIDAAVARAE